MTSNRTRLRWTLASAIGLLAVVQALRTLPSLSSHAPLGAAALLALALLTIAGLASLWSARRRIDRELDGLSARPATGELVKARRERLAQIAAGGGTPDLSALAEATAASERGQAYLGRYLVAVAVLIGLIGTFAGLAEALRALPAILGGATVDPQKLASLLSAPLAGLDVTFAAGIVGILSTLALSLAQGDLQLAEDGMLARLEEETTHELIPALWPRTHSVEERMLRELAQLREDNRTLLVEASAAIGARVAEVTARSTADMAQRLTAAVETSTLKLATEVQRGFTDAMRAHGEASTTLRTDGAVQLATLKQSGEALVQLATRSASALETRLSTEAGHIASALEKTHTAQQSLGEALRLSAEQSALRVGEKLDTLTTQLQDQSAATQRVLVEGATESGRVAAQAVESLRATLADGLSAERLALVASLDATRVALVEGLTATRIELAEGLSTARAALIGGLTVTRDELVDQLTATRVDLVGELSSSRTALVDELSGSRVELVTQLSGVRVELGTELHAAAEALRGEASSARAALDDSAARAIASMDRSVEALSAVVTEANRSMSGQVTAAAELITDSAARAQESLTASTMAAQRTMVDGLAQAQHALTAGATQAQLAIADGASEAQLAIADGAAQATSLFADSISRAEKALADGAILLSTAASEELSVTREALVEATHGAHGALSTALETALARLETLLVSSRTELESTLDAGREAVDRLVADSVGALASSASTLAQSADTLARTGDVLGPQLESLAPELRALSQEVALLGARTEQTDEPLFADELVRLGEGMERLEALVKLAQSHGESAQG